MSNGDPIIIKGGGSIEILLSKDTFPADSPTAARHFNKDRHITRVYIVDETTGAETECPFPKKGRFSIRIDHK
jgi:hypothetical protein